LILVWLFGNFLPNITNAYLMSLFRKLPSYLNCFFILKFSVIYFYYIIHIQTQSITCFPNIIVYYVVIA
jgi:hypothetical protein